ncbi:MAG: hypothetical protein CML16_12855 [Pusillimonas sp.]|nr:hypothetical protein [Pusillimonas sp.]
MPIQLQLPARSNNVPFLCIPAVQCAQQRNNSQTTRHVQSGASLILHGIFKSGHRQQPFSTTFQRVAAAAHPIIVLSATATSANNI